MGIEGLLPLLKPIQRQIHIKNYTGKAVAIDGHCILHRGAYGAAAAIAEGTDTDTYVTHFMHYIGLLKYNGVTPIVVFDGLPLPIKKITNDKRSKHRTEKLEMGRRLQKQGDHASAEKCFQQAISITTEMVRKVILKLMKEKVQCIVSPYESDAQLAYLMKTKKVEAVITEDSDLIAFGCSKLIYKLDRGGACMEINSEEIFSDFRVGLRLFNADLLRRACIASGCDYLPSLRGVGLKTAILAFKRYADTENALLCLKRNIQKSFVPDDYNYKFEQAHRAFLHQWVYDMDETDYVRLHPLPEGIAGYDVDFLGKKPAVKDLTLLRVNKIIPKKKDVAKPVVDVGKSLPSSHAADASSSRPVTASVTSVTTAPTECLVSSITKQVIAYVDSVKENIKPQNYDARYCTTLKGPLKPKDGNKQFQTAKDTAKQTLPTHNPPAKSSAKRSCEFILEAQPSPDEVGRRKRRILSLY